MMLVVNGSAKPQMCWRLAWYIHITCKSADFHIGRGKGRWWNYYSSTRLPNTDPQFESLDIFKKTFRYFHPFSWWSNPAAWSQTAMSFSNPNNVVLSLNLIRRNWPEQTDVKLQHEEFGFWIERQHVSVTTGKIKIQIFLVNRKVITVYLRVCEHADVSILKEKLFLTLPL